MNAAIHDLALIEAEQEAARLIDAVNASPLADDDPEYLAMCDRIWELEKFILSTPAVTMAGLAPQVRLFVDFATDKKVAVEDCLEAAGAMIAATATRLAGAVS